MITNTSILWKYDQQSVTAFVEEQLATVDSNCRV